MLNLLNIKGSIFTRFIILMKKKYFWTDKLFFSLIASNWFVCVFNFIQVIPLDITPAAQKEILSELQILYKVICSQKQAV